MRCRVLVLAALVASAAGLAGQDSRSKIPVTTDVFVERATPSVADSAPSFPWTPAGGLTRSDFDVRVDEANVPIVSFSAADQPLSLIVLLDVSASTEIPIDCLLDPLKDGLIPALKTGDRVAFGRFGGVGVRMDALFDTEPSQMKRAAADVLTRPPAGSAFVSATRVIADDALYLAGENGGFGVGGSPMWDAVIAAVSRLESQPGRRAIVLISDGRASANEHSLNEAIAYAAAADISVHAVLGAINARFEQIGANPVRLYPAGFMKSIAENTGGAYADIFSLDPMRPRREVTIKKWLNAAVTRIAGDLHSIYTLGFVPPAHDGRFHQLDVAVRTPGAKVRARHLYLAQ